ncbi:hypothetical protein PMIN06_008270 [Paraphaeosphaeria minitans]|uniref:Major facilitator superfamily transporter n=1 Tax=Paraphaeosphaeria minitans TaxID=565426 RepID=A0A9P6GL09_9PLEO|nr:major facilitator superfamily transporter [Paraphaeosphaeria minitans]
MGTPAKVSMDDAGKEEKKMNTLTQDVEKGAEEVTLQRTVSGPPYSIFTPRMKLWIIFLVSVSALISPFGATLFYPVLNVLSDELHVTPTKTNIAITTYMIAQAIAPALIAGMSDASGRRLSFIICFVIFIAANIGLALQTNYIALLLLRCVQAFGCSAAIALTIAVVADISTSAERGTYMGYATAGILFGPSFGPTIGGILAQYLGWRSIFWFLAIFAGVLLLIFTFFFPETCRAVVGNGSVPPTGVNRSVLSYLRERRRRQECNIDDGGSTPPEKRKFSFPNPLMTLRILSEKESCILLLYNGFFFTGMMVVSAALPDLFKEAYGLDEIKIGLCYISIGAGCLVSSLTMGHVVDWNFRRHAALNNIPITKSKQQDIRNFPIEKVRLQVGAPGHLIGTLSLIAFGWTVKYRTHIAGPEIALFFMGFGTSTAFNQTNTLLIDLHRNQAATATAAVNFVRCLMSAAGCAAIIPMCHAMNPGWAFTLLGLVYAVLISVVFWIMKNGMKWRLESEEKKRAAEDGQ